MGVTYKNKKIQKVCTELSYCDKVYGNDMTAKIQQRLDELKAANTVEMMIQFRIGRCHPLTGKRKGQYALDLIQPYRLIFEKIGDTIQIAKIIEIVDYH